MSRVIPPLPQFAFMAWCSVKAQGQLYLYHAMKAFWGSAGMAPLIPRPRHYMEVSGQIHASATIPPGKQPLVPTGQEAG
jgi:hypothetical protein